MSGQAAIPSLKWYFAANLNALRFSFDQIEAAVKSARLRTGLRPFCLIDDREGLALADAQLSWLKQAGVAVIRHQAELFNIVRRHFGPAADPFTGHWLRCDIPVLEEEDDIVLYTDIDVMFRKPIDFSYQRPPFLACAPEHRQDDFSYFNSGVMIMNIPALRASRQELISVLRDRLGNMEPHDDQGAFNVTFRNSWTRLPNQYNWKPYWGFNDDAAIVHFHGPKPAAVRRMLVGEEHLYPSFYGQMFHRNPEGYAKYLAEFDRVLNAEIGL